MAVTTIGTLSSIPGQTIGVGVFTDKLITELNLSRTQLSLAYMFGTIISSFILPFAGTLTDRLGCRIMITASSALMGLSLIIMSQASTIAGFFSSTIAIISITALLFLFIRFFGQGCLTIVSRVCLAKWFNHRRGLATGISSVFTGYFFSASPALLNYLVTEFGWKQSYVILAAAIGFGMTFLGWLLYRDNPEQCGLVMDGRDDQQWHEKMTKKIPQTLKQFTRSEAVKTLAFWSFALVLGWQALYMTAVTFHITSLGVEAGLNRDQAYQVFPIIGFLTLFVTLGGGWLSDRIKLKKLLIANTLCLAVSAVGLLKFSSFTGKALFCTGYGFSGGFFGLLLTVTWPRYFGRKHVGAINGLISSILVFASAIGPILFSGLKDITGNFRTVVIFSILVPCSMIWPALKIRNPQSIIRERLNSKTQSPDK